MPFEMYTKTNLLSNKHEMEDVLNTYRDIGKMDP